MPTSPSFVEHALELLSGVGPIQARRMFGGFGISLNGHNIAIIDDDLLFLKVDDQTRPQFEAQGAKPFIVPMKKGPMVSKGYLSLPEEAVDDPEVAVTWGRLASEAALRAAEAKKPKRRTSLKPTATKVSSAAPAQSSKRPSTTGKSPLGKGNAAQPSRTAGKSSAGRRSSSKHASARKQSKVAASARTASTRKNSALGAVARKPAARKRPVRQDR